MKGLRLFKMKKMAAVLLTACMVTALTGCSGSAKSESADYVTMGSAANGSFAEIEESVSMESAAMDSGSFGTSYDGAMMEAPTEVATESGTTSVAVSERKLIKTVDMDVETQEFDTLLSTIESQVTELGGYIENMNTYNGSRYYTYRDTRNANMTLRVPKDNLNIFLNTITDISNVVRRSDNVEDVTLSYVDLESHRDALRTEQTRLLELLENAESLEDILTIEQRLSDVRYQLKSMESRLRTYDNQVDYSTVNLSIEEVEVFTPVKEETVGERISHGFSDSWESIGNSIVEFGVWFVINLPYMIVCMGSVVVFVLIILGIVKVCNRKSRKVNGQKEQSQNKQENANPNK